jgi:asparagine synthase (glutamine-hydrolysing)
MSGIAGIIRSGNEPGPGQSAAVARMLRALEVKGPDAQAVWEEGPVSLALTVFRTTPEQAQEVGPTQVAHLVVVADARLDEREYLLDSLDIPRVAHASVSDSEAIGRAYLRWGKACVDHLTGDFSFALWDRKSRLLFCARDVFAIRPFYFAELPGGLIFGSNIPAFRASGLLKVEPDPIRVYDTLAAGWLGYGEAHRSFFREVLRLPAGHRLTFSNGRVHNERYSVLEPSREPLPKDWRELPALFRGHFERAVRRRLRGVGPIASMLSGGLDSGAVACAARDELRRCGAPPLVTCSVHNDPPFDQESSYIRDVQAGGHLEAHDLRLGQLAEFAPAMISYLEWSPLSVGEWATVPLWLACAETARRSGARILFTGETGDSALGVSCEPILRALREGDLWGAFALPLSEARAYGFPLSSVAPRMVRETSHLLQQEVMRPRAPALYWALRRQRHAAIHRRNHPDHVRPLPRVQREEHVARLSATRVAVDWPAEGREDHVFAYGVDRFHGSVGDIWDRVGTAFGVEARHPIFDRELVQFCMAVPWRERMRGGRTKALLRHSGILPPRHATQGAMPNANPHARLAMALGAQEWLGQQLERSQVAETWFFPEYVEDLRHRWRHTGTRNGPFMDSVLEIAAFTEWLGRSLD